MKSNRHQSSTLRPKIRGLFAWLAVVGVLAAAAPAEAARVHVRGHVRRDGSYVMPHYRTSPDRRPFNNYGFPGNYNPNTGRFSTGSPAQYLLRYDTPSYTWTP